ncbi:hypothetical protein R1sor_015454 [Riccia sorocarpa]|uniref:Uncharacterized protein n=1 Tax=Riccia sorocarpa TaxID=122646 RepID=A0ABD3HCA3_9MARC
MTRPPRPKYPSDKVNYHDLKKPDAAITTKIQVEDARSCCILRMSEVMTMKVEFEEVEDDPEGTDLSDEETRDEAGQISDVDVMMFYPGILRL